MELLDQTDDATTAAPPAQAPTDEAQPEHDEQRQEDEALNCAACGQEVTHTKHRTSVGGQFAHTCVNPAGILFEIGCFKEADGCREIGPESDDFSWFDGYVWQVAICTNCKTHLGWRFWSSDNEFYGLILNRLS
ncbi:hypothetical protein FIV42_18625 [Persicimonas caeni]|uniref:CULT domain-containing protein n=1 Tax=Persicimonas caeni TaxID=2292766 RepID=A0A4Y6PWG4_PERCE|nr:cereblon family protein [Persicimonas caeni]QDG52681.1 hypothetical protein FIV42_18625 [Persicimonas caeni]QED33903.1 hypothetical protein FRD00_18620 [Persicimonas caeni]